VELLRCRDRGDTTVIIEGVKEIKIVRVIKVFPPEWLRIAARKDSHSEQLSGLSQPSILGEDSAVHSFVSE
jgi:hypothetical protein